MLMYDGQESLDDDVWDKNDEDCEKGQLYMRRNDNCHKVEILAEEKFGAKATVLSPLRFGGFNVLHEVQLENHYPPVVMVRLPCPGVVQFPQEKTIQEAATAALIAKETQLPIPTLFFYGHDMAVGPYLIMERIEFSGSVSKKLTRPNKDTQAPHVLDPDVPESTLLAIWGQIARCQLEISRMKFPRIGALVPSDGGFEVAGRPLSHNMTDMVRLANVPFAVLPSEEQTYESADQWYTALAEMNLAQLVFQHNDCITSEDDCRNKYVARQVFRRLAKQGHLSTFGFAEDNWSAQSQKLSTSLPAPSATDSFRIWGDDFRAGNILLDESDKIAALIDWEFTYIGPTQFTLDPPWWLLIETIEMWEDGIDNWFETYEKRLQTWLKAMKTAEAQAESERDGRGTSCPSLLAPLSEYMKESWRTGRFFLNYGARKSWAFDCMYWKYLDERFFGSRESDTKKKDLWKTRVSLLSEDERAAMETFVKQKMAEKEDRRIVTWIPIEAKRHFSKVLFD